MDHHLWFGLCLLYDVAAGSKYVYHFRTFKEADDKILWNKTDSLVGFLWPFLFHFCGNYVFSETNSGKAGLAGKIKDSAAKIDRALSSIS